MTTKFFSLPTATAAGLLNSCLVLLLSGSATLAAPDYSQILGDWESNYGPVHIDLKAKEKPEGSAEVTGHWTEDNHRGEIESGHYNSGTGELALSYVETWTKIHGKATLKLDESTKSFSGSFKSDDGSTGDWTWKRKP